MNTLFFTYIVAFTKHFQFVKILLIKYEILLAKQTPPVVNKTYYNCHNLLSAI